MLGRSEGVVIGSHGTQVRWDMRIGTERSAKRKMMHLYSSLTGLSPVSLEEKEHEKTFARFEPTSAIAPVI
jgi:hypothetical protein